MPSKYTCDGESINPPLSFLDVPANAKSLVLIMDDPDAPMGNFVHWILLNIDPKTIGIKENSVPQAASQGETSVGKIGYVDACPPARLASESVAGRPTGTHRYFFKLYALDTVLNLINPDKAALEKAMEDHILDKAELIGLYGH